MIVLKVFEKDRSELPVTPERDQPATEMFLNKNCMMPSRNEHLLELMRIQKSLTYFVTALRSNELLFYELERTNFLGLNEDEKEFLADLLLIIHRLLKCRISTPISWQYAGCLCKHHCEQPETRY
jgi:magnesium transporter